MMQTIGERYFSGFLHGTLISLITGEKFTGAARLGNNNQGKFDQQDLRLTAQSRVRRQ